MAESAAGVKHHVALSVDFRWYSVAEQPAVRADLPPATAEHFHDRWDEFVGGHLDSYAADRKGYADLLEIVESASAAADVRCIAITGSGRAFSAGTDVTEMASRTIDPDNFQEGVHGFPGLVDQLTAWTPPDDPSRRGLIHS